MKKQMYKRGLAGVAMWIVLTFGVQIVSANTVEYAHVFVPDRAHGATYDRTRYEQTWGSFTAVYPKDIPGYGIDQNITDGRIVYNGNRYRMPFLNGYDHVVGIAGHLTDMLDRVEIVVNGNVVRTIRKSALLYSGATKRDHPETREQQRKGMVAFKVNKADLPNLNEDFQIRIRFAVEVAGFDKLDCKVVHGSGQIKSMHWTTYNGAELPEIISRPNKYNGYKTNCSPNRLYNLRMIIMKAPQSIQVGDGINKKILERNVTNFRKIEGTRMMDTVDVTFTEKYVSMVESEMGEDPERFVLLCDGEVGNIPGGWGSYIYMSIADNLSGSTGPNGYQTNLTGLNLCGEAGGTVAPPRQIRSKNNNLDSTGCVP
ncbi:MAG: hypothetical protein V4642_02910 [Bacteroidota bacterium]